MSKLKKILKITADVSVIIPTFNRSSSLKKALESVMRQSVIPREVIVIDQSECPFDLKKNCEFEQIPRVSIRVIHRPDLKNQLTKARNVGIKEASSSKIQFMDDDCFLEPLYFKKILPLLNSNLGAVCGRIIEPKTRFNYFAKYFQKIFFLGDFRQIREEWYHESYPKELITNILPGVALFKREVLEEFEFDPNLPGGYLGDDIEISFRASKKFKFLLTPRPKIRHLPDKINRLDKFTFGFQKAQFYKYHFDKNIEKTVRNWLSYYWLNVGLLAHAILELNLKQIFGTYKGIRLKILKTAQI